MIYSHRRRLVINIGEGNLVHIYWGAKILGKFIFRQKILEKFIFRQKILEKFPSILSKISDYIFLVIDNFLKKITPFIQNVLPLSLYCCLCFCFLSCLFFLNKQN